MQTEIHGTISLEIDPQAISCFVSIVKSPKPGDDDAWTVERILESLRAGGITEGIDPRRIGDLFAKAAKSPDKEVKFLVAEAVAPVLPTLDKALWNENAVPDALQATAKQLVAAAPAPSMAREVTEIVKKKKKIIKKSNLPFVAPKEEIVIISEKIVKQVPVTVDPTVVAIGFVEAGAKLATITPGKPGVNGRNIYGEVITAKVEGATTAMFGILFGNGVQKKGAELLATCGGFSRQGADWIDIIEFRPHQWSLELSADKASCLLSFTPGSPQAPRPSAQEIRDKAGELSFDPGLLLPDQQITDSIAAAIRGGEPLVALPICVDEDAAIDIVIAENRLKAVLNLQKGRGRGTPLLLKAVGRAIRESGVRLTDAEKLKTDVSAFFSSTETTLIGYSIAQGTAPTKGADLQAEFTAAFVKPAEADKLRAALAAAPTADGDADAGAVNDADSQAAGIQPQEITHFAYVTAGEHVINIIPGSVGQPGTDVFGHEIPGLPGTETAIGLGPGLERKNHLVAAAVSGILDRALRDGTILVRVREHLDATQTLVVAADKMSATLTMTPSRGTGRRIERETIDAALKTAGVTYGIHANRIAQAVAAAAAGREIANLVVAEGRPPREGTKNRLRFLLERASGRDVTLRPDGSADYRNQDRITRVATGQPLAEILPPEVHPESGWDVTGKEIRPEAQISLDIEIGANVDQKDVGDGVIRLVSAVNGELVYDEKHIEVLEVHTLKGDVNLTSGNIKFPGTVQIGGSVSPGFYVLSDADVKIAGNIDAALVSAAGDIMVKGGVKGAGKAVLRAKASILAGYIEHSTVLAVGDIKIKGSCLRSVVRSNGRMVMGTEKGWIIGGTLKVRRGIHTTHLGSERGIKTEISFGQDYLIQDQIDAAEREIKKIQQRLAEIDQEMRRPEMIDNRSELQRLFQEKTQKLKLIEKHGLRLFTLREKFEEHYESEVVVTGSLFPGVTFESHGRTLEITTPAKAVRVAFDTFTGRIEANPLKTKAEG